VYKATRDALVRAKRGDGPTLIECFTYRMADHTTADDASRYRTKEEVAAWEKRDPILRLKLFMGKKGLWTDQYQKEVEMKAKAAVDEAERKAEAVPPPDPRDMFKHTCRTLSQRQQKEIEDF